MYTKYTVIRKTSWSQFHFLVTTTNNMHCLKQEIKYLFMLAVCGQETTSLCNLLGSLSTFFVISATCVLQVPLLWSILIKYGQQMKPLKKCLSFCVAGQLKSSTGLLMKKTPQNLKPKAEDHGQINTVCCTLMISFASKTKENKQYVS